jgi:hypothetical protein
VVCAVRRHDIYDFVRVDNAGLRRRRAGRRAGVARAGRVLPGHQRGAAQVAGDGHQRVGRRAGWRRGAVAGGSRRPLYAAAERLHRLGSSRDIRGAAGPRGSAGAGPSRRGGGSRGVGGLWCTTDSRQGFTAGRRPEGNSRAEAGDELWGHGGGFIGFTAWALHSPEGGYTIAVTGNLSEFDVTSVIADLQQVIASESED